MPSLNLLPLARRPLASLGSLGLALAMALALMATGCGGGGGGAGAGGPAPSGSTALVPARSGDVVGYVKLKASEASSGSSFEVLPTATPAVSQGDGAAPADGPVSGTPLQEAGVDEDDLLKAEGSRVVHLQQLPSGPVGQAWARVVLHELASGGRLVTQARLDLPAEPEAWGRARGLYLLPGAARAAVLSSQDGQGGWGDCPPNALCPAVWIGPGGAGPAKVWVDLLDARDPTAPRWSSRLRLDGRLIDSRRIGNALVLVTQHQPAVVAEALALSGPGRDERLARLDAREVLPQVSRNGGPAQPLLSETDCHLQPGNASTDVLLTTVTVLDLGQDDPSPRSHCVIGGTEAVYMAPEHLYLATTRWHYNTAGYDLRTTTDIHKFAVSLDAIDYRGSAEVPGHLGWNTELKSFRLSEHQGDLRVLSFTGDEGWGLAMPMEAGGTAAATQRPPDSPATLTVLRELPGERRLQAIGQLPNARRPAAIGKPGEQVYGVRFVGSRGYVVTFRRTDPLYVLDLSDPTDPKTLGALETAGFSNHLLPLGGGLLLGVGQDATASGQVGGVKVALFDVSDGARPRELAARVFGYTGSASGLDASRHGIDLATRGDTVRVALPLLLWGPGFSASAQGLQRLEVDTRAGTLSDRGLIDSPAAVGTYDLGQERAVQIDEQLLYLSGGELGAWGW